MASYCADVLIIVLTLGQVLLSVSVLMTGVRVIHFSLIYTVYITKARDHKMLISLKNY